MVARIHKPLRTLKPQRSVAAKVTLKDGRSIPLVARLKHLVLKSC